MKVLIDSGNGFVDYTQYCLDGTLTIEDSINVPTVISFQLAASNTGFVVPVRSSYVKIVSEIYAQPNGYIQAGQTAANNGKILATGFVTNEPTADYLGLNPNLPKQSYQQLAWSINVTSDEWLLNCQGPPYIPAFVGQTDSQILAALAEALMPGLFNTTSYMASGNIVPYYQYNPTQTWSDIAKTFAEQNNFYYKVINKTIIYQPFGVDPINPGLGILYDEVNQVEPELFPLQLKSPVLTVPPVNDCVVIGDVEPQDNWDCYFVGDGFTSNYQLTHQMFQGTSSSLLEDDWTESSFSQGTWIVNDPENCFALVDSDGNPVGALNIIQKGVPTTYTPIQDATWLQAQNGLELGGGLNLQHGQVTFNDTASGGGGLIGGLFEEVTEYDPGHCLAGFFVEGQPSLGGFTVVLVSATGATQALALTINGVNTELATGNVFSCAGFTNATFLNGQSAYITQITQNNGSYTLLCTPQNPGILPANYGPTSDSGTITFASNAVIVTASGAAGIYCYPLYNGQTVGTPVVSQPNHQYVLQTWIGAQAPTRFTRPFTNLTRTATYGAQNLASSGTITWVMTDYNIGNYVVQEQFPLFGLFPASPPPVVTQYSATGANLPSFAIYVLLSGLDLNLSLNYTELSVPPQGFLTVQSLTGNSGTNLPWLPNQLTEPIVYQLGFGMINQTAQIGQSGEVYQLQFYTDDIPSVGARIRFQSWAAGQAIARVRDPIAIANEGKISGDSGVRSATITNLSPLPRTSDECEAAAAAAILDREYPQFQGSYTIQTQPWRFLSLFNPSMYDYPHTGMFFTINAPQRGIYSASGSFYVNTVRIQVVELREEILTISIDYGPDLYLEKLLPAFLTGETITSAVGGVSLLSPQQTVPAPNPITLDEVLTAYLPTLNSAKIALGALGTPLIVNAVSGNYIVVDLSGGQEANPANSNAYITAIGATGCEVRYVDNGWGIAGKGRVGIFTVDQFTLPRTVRDQTFYMRGINGGVFSRFSKAIRVAAPLVPSSPTLVSANATTAVFDYAGDVRDIYGLEIRAFPVSGTLFYVGTPTTPDSIAQFNRSLVNPNPNTLNNVTAVYNPSSDSYPFPYPTELNVGDIIYVTCPNDSSFQGLEIVSNTVAAITPVSPVSPVSVSGLSFVQGTTAYFYWETNNGNGFPRTYPTSSQLVQGNYNNPQASVPIGSLQWNSPMIGKGNDPQVFPLLNDQYDAHGNYLGAIATPSSLINDGTSLAGYPMLIGGQNYDMIVSGGLIIPVAGNYTFQFVVDDGFLLGIGGGASYVSGEKYNPVGQTITAMCGLPIVAAFNNPNAANPFSTVINFPASGVYPFELDYTQERYAQMCCITVTQAPAGAFAANVPQLTGLGGYVILPAIPNSGSPSQQGVLWQFGWFDYNEHSPDNIGQNQIGVSNQVGTTQQIQTGMFSYVASGTIQGGYTGLCTIETEAPHGFAVGEQVIIGCGWASWPSTLPTPPQTGAVFCGQWTVSAVPAPNIFEFVMTAFQSVNNLGTWAAQIAASGTSAGLVGVCAPMPTQQTTANLPIASGVLVQRPIFAPSDLVVDFTQPDIAESLEILQALSPNSVVGGLTALFFNLTWDYSAPTPISAFVVPQLVNIVINSQTQQIEWGITQGEVAGHRIAVVDPTTGVTYNRFTIDHSDNPSRLVQFKVNPIDFASTRDIHITPFNGLGDGPTYIISNVSSYVITGNQTPGSYSIGLAYNGVLPANTSIMRLPLDIPIQFAINWAPSQAYLETPFTTSGLLQVLRIPYGQPIGLETIVCTINFAPGANYAVISSAPVPITSSNPLGVTNFNAGDVLRVVTENVDGTAANLGLILSAIKN